MSGWLLDTNTVSYALRNEGRVNDRLRSTLASSLAISAITLAELRYGADLRNSAKIHAAIDDFISDVQVLPFTPEAANAYARLMAMLDGKGQSIDDHDGLIAGHAVATRRKLVTRNVKHFKRVKGLNVVDWY